MASNTNTGRGGSASTQFGSRGGVAPTRAKPMSDHKIHKCWGGSQNFHHSYGLRLWNPDDVEEGKAICQAMRDADAAAEADANELQAHRELGRFTAGGRAPTRAKPMSDHEIHKLWGGRQNFYLSYGLKLWNPDEVEEGKAICQAMRGAARIGTVLSGQTGQAVVEATRF